MNKKIFLLLPALGLLLCGCQPQGGNEVPPTPDPDPVVVDRVEIDHETLSLEVGQTFQLAASVKPISLEDRTYTWSSDAATVASVDASGMVTAVEEGTAHIRATANADTTKYAECTVTVTPEMVTVALTDPAAIKASTQTLKFGANQKNVGAYYFFTGSVDGSTRGNTSASWAEGVQVKLEDAGSSKYYITMGEGADKQYFEMDDVHHFAVVSTPTAGREWEWNSTYGTVQRTISGQSDSKNNGTFLPGTYQTFTTISGCNLNQADSDFFFQFVYKTLPVAPTSVTLSAASDKIYQGGTLQVEAELGPAGAAGELVWSVTGDEHVTVDQNGLVSATEEAALNAAITVKAAYAEDETVFGTLNLTVAQLINYGTAENPLTLDQAKAVLDITGSAITAEEVYLEGVIYSSSYSTKYSNYTIWLANADGTVGQYFELYATVLDSSITGDYTAANALRGKRVVAHGYGKIYNTTYELTNNGSSYPTIISMVDEPATVTAVNLDKTTADVLQGGTLQLKASYTPVFADPTINWTVENNDKVSVSSNGLVTVAADAVAESTATVKATVGSVSATCVITVKSNEGGGGVEATLEVNTAIGQWTVTGADSSSEQATLSANPFSFVYNIGTATTYISSYSSNTTYAIRFYAGSSCSISWDTTSVDHVISMTFTTNSKHFATNATFTGGALDSSYTAAGATCKVNVNESATSLSWSNAAQVRVEAVTIVYVTK